MERAYKYNFIDRCHKCGKEIRWASSGSYRAAYCDPCGIARLEEWNEKLQKWNLKELHENASKVI